MLVGFNLTVTQRVLPMDNIATFLRNCKPLNLTLASYGGAVLLGISSSSLLGIVSSMTTLVTGLFLVMVSHQGMGMKLEIAYQEELKKTGE